jgi:hypothetical protein
MKKNLLSILAAIVAIGLVSFTSLNVSSDEVRVTYKYAIYSSGNQDQLSSYTIQSAQPSACSLSSTLCFFRVEDVDENGTISATEFGNAFANFDSDGDKTLNDETEDPLILEKKN